MTQVLQYNHAGQVIVCPHRGEAVPSSIVNITIQNSGGTETLAQTPATKSSFSTTLSANAAKGAKNIAVTAVTGLSVGDPFVLADSHGRTELCVASGIDTSALTIALQSRLHRAYASGNAAEGALISYTLDTSADTDTWAKRSDYSAVFECTDWTAVRAVVFRIVDGSTSNPIEFEHVRRWVQNVDIVSDDHDDPELSDCRNNAWDLIRTIIDGSADGADTDVWRDASKASVVGGLLAAAIFSLQHGHVDYAHELAGDPLMSGGLYVTYWEAFRKHQAWYDRNQDRIVDTYEPRRVTSRRVRRGL